MSDRDENPPSSDDLFDRVYEAHLQYVWNTLRRLGIPARDLEDLSHDVFIVVHRRLPEYDRDRPIRPWLFGIAYRVAAQYRRKFSTHRERLDVATEATETSTPSDELSRKQARDIVSRALGTLDFERRAIFVMYEIDGVAVPEIADQLSVPLNTAYSRLRLARRDFKAAVERMRLSGDEA